MTESPARPPSAECPDETELLAFSLGRVDGADFERIGGHLSSCTNCEGRLESFNDPEDSVLANLRLFLKTPQKVENLEFGGLAKRANAAFELAVSPAPEIRGHESSDWKPEPLSRLDRYELAQELGRGGMGVVYSAFHGNLNKRFALKVIHPAYLSDPHAVLRFRREIRALGELNHVNIVAATDAGEAEGRQFLVMEYVDGMDLGTLLRICRTIPVADACELARQACLGLQYVHERGWVHRDLKPSNLMLSSDGIVKILDLGLARVFSEETSESELTRSHQAMGTTDYMAPEQWQGGAVDIRADIYSLGCTLYKLLTGSAPFAEIPNERESKRNAHQRLAPPPLRERRADVSEALATVVGRMLAKAPQDRFAGPAEVARQLAPLARGCNLVALLRQAVTGRDRQKMGAKTEPPFSETAVTPSPAGSPLPADSRMVRRSRAMRGVIVAAALLLLVAVATLATVAFFLRKEDDFEIPVPKPNPPAAAKEVIWPGDYPDELRVRHWTKAVELIGPRSRVRRDDCEMRHHLEPPEFAKQTLYRPLWCRRLYGGGGYISSDLELQLWPKSKADPTPLTVVALENDLRNQWFEMTAELPRFIGESRKGPRGIFFGWREDGAGKARAYFVHLDLDPNPGNGSPHGELVCGPVALDLKTKERENQVVAPLGLYQDTPPHRQSLKNPAMNHRLQVSTSPGKITVQLNSEDPMQFVPLFEPHGARGIWVQDGGGRFRRVTTKVVSLE